MATDVRTEPRTPVWRRSATMSTCIADGELLTGSI